MQWRIVDEKYFDQLHCTDIVKKRENHVGDNAVLTVEPYGSE